MSNDRPLYNTTLGLADLPQSGTFKLHDTTFRVFPLLVADPERLQTLCNVWLNQEGTAAQDAECASVPPSEFVHNRPYGKLVFLMVAYYPKMKLTKGNRTNGNGSSPKGGWWRQKEVSFAIPVITERRKNGEVVETMSLCTRHIFVDDPVSLGTGREVFGWPKRLSILREGVDPWFEWQGPRVPRQLMTLHTQVFSRTNGNGNGGQAPKGQDGPLWQRQMLMEVWRHPPRLLKTLKALFGLVPHLSRKRLTRRFFKIAINKLLGKPYSFGINAINLKQFRDAVNPSDACYQAIVNSPFKMTVEDCALLFGDFKLHIRRHDSQPVVQDLGLEATRCEDHEHCSIVEPLAPFWLKADMDYDAGETICWRAEGTAWENGSPAASSVRSLGAFSKAPQEFDKPPPFTINSASPVPQMGPLRLSGGSVRLFALCVQDHKKLTGFCSNLLNVADENLPEEDWIRFRPIGSHVMLTVAHFPKVRPDRAGASSKREPVGWSHSEMVFWVPLLWEERVDGCWVAKHIAVINPYSFVDHPIALGTVRETLGWPRTLGHLRRGADPLLEWMWPDAPRRLMSLETRVFPEPGSEHQSRVLIEIVRERGTQEKFDHEPLDGLMAWTKLLGTVHGLLEESPEHVSWEDVSRLAVSNPGVVKCVNLKQFRDAQEPNRACYQAVVSSDIRISNFRFAPLDDEFLIKLHRYDSYPIVDRLGLEINCCERLEQRRTSSLDPVGDTEVITRDVIKPVRYPLWVEADVVYDGAEKLYWRAGTRPWERGRFANQNSLPKSLSFRPRQCRIDVTNLDLWGPVEVGCIRRSSCGRVWWRSTGRPVFRNAEPS